MAVIFSGQGRKRELFFFFVLHEFGHAGPCDAAITYGRGFLIHPNVVMGGEVDMRVAGQAVELMPFLCAMHVQGTSHFHEAQRDRVRIFTVMKGKRDDFTCGEDLLKKGRVAAFSFFASHLYLLRIQQENTCFPRRRKDFARNFSCTAGR
ncbi:MAG: hypothetical protein IKJ34_07890 [Mailhella sp.]|nr:hypothetical protein [Mailhella sp.]